MKKNIVLLISFIFNISLVSIIIFAYSRRHLLADYKHLYTYSSNEEYKDKTSKKCIVFVGNSITLNWVHLNTPFFGDNNYICRGIGGQSRFRHDVVELKPLAVVINAGTNDIAEADGFYKADFTLNNIKSMAEIAEANDIKVVLSSVLPAEEYTRLFGRKITDVPRKINELNILIKTYADNKGFAYIDYNTAMCDANGAMRTELSIDGVHPSEGGYDIMQSLLKPTLDSLQTIMN